MGTLYWDRTAGTTELSCARAPSRCSGLPEAARCVCSVQPAVAVTICDPGAQIPGRQCVFVEAKPVWKGVRGGGCPLVKAS